MEKNWAWWCVPVTPAVAGSLKKGQHEQKVGPYFTMTQSKKGWRHKGESTCLTSAKL
jgi:hypothetical protein